jgi:mRNA-degrading endonuclease HigB of HigAB toxin-antitoxin module
MAVATHGIWHIHAKMEKLNPMSTQLAAWLDTVERKKVNINESLWRILSANLFTVSLIGFLEGL